VRFDHVAGRIVNANHSIVRADERLTAFVELKACLAAERQESDFCQSWHGQAAARFNRRAPTPNAIRVSVINDRVDPVSATAPTVVQVPGLF
jgi:hypothetical protein